MEATVMLYQYLYNILCALVVGFVSCLRSRGDRGHRSSGNAPPQFIPQDVGAPTQLRRPSGSRPSSGQSQEHVQCSPSNGHRPSSQDRKQQVPSGSRPNSHSGGQNSLGGNRHSSRPNSPVQHSPAQRHSHGPPPGGRQSPNGRPSNLSKGPGTGHRAGPPPGGYNMPPPGGRNSPSGARKGGQFGNMPAPGPPPPGGMFVLGGGPAPPPGAYSGPPPLEPLKPERSIEHNAAMEQGSAPTAYKATKQGHGMHEEDTDPVLKELNATWPNVIASVVSRSPGMCMLLMFVILLAVAAPAFLPDYAPSPLTEFDSLQIKDHPAAANAFSVLTLDNEDTFFRRREDVQPTPPPTAAGTAPEDADSTGRKLSQLFTGRSGPDLQFYTTEDTRVVHDVMHSWRGLGNSIIQQGHHRKLNQDLPEGLPEELPEELPEQVPDGEGGSVDTEDVGAGGFGLGVGQDCVKDERELGEERFLVIFFRYRADSGEEPRNAITQEMVAKTRQVEETIKAYPEYEEICQRQCDGRCQEILSFSTFVHTTKESYVTGKIELQDEPVWDLQEAGEFLVANNFTFFFNIDSNGTSAVWLRSIFAFQQESGLKSGQFPYEDKMVNKLIRLFEREQTNDIIINYGEFVINSVQINQQIFRDLRWAALSLFLAGVMLRVGSGSWFMTFAGVFQLVISFPISWLVYSAPNGWKFVNFIHFLAPFVMLGIGLDDIFVSLAFFQNTRPFMGYFALDTRLTTAFLQASSAMLATSTTSAFAFAANIFSPVPAVQSFGLLLATLVVINYILAITWLPVCLAVWDKHFEFPRRAAEANGESTLCSCTLFSCCGCGGCARKRRSPAANMAQTLRIIKGGQEPRALEFMQVVMPYFRTLNVTEQIKNHRLLHPDRPPVKISRSELAHVNQENAYVLFGRTIDVRRIIGVVFDTVFQYRWFTIAVCLVATAIGAAGTVALESPPTSEPPIFDSDHNVQFFYRYITGNESDNVPGCPACLQGTMETWTGLNADASNPLEFFDTSKPLIGFEEGSFSTVVSDVIYGIAEGGIDNSPNTKDGDPAGAPQSNKLTFDESFDISSAAGQQLIQNNLDDLKNYTTPIEGRSLYTDIEYNPLDKMRVYCSNPTTPEEDAIFEAENRGIYCSSLDGVDGLPTGNVFRGLAYKLLATSSDITIRDFMGYKRQEESGQTAFDFIDCSNQFPNIVTCCSGFEQLTCCSDPDVGACCGDPNAVTCRSDNFPKVDWVRIQVRTTTKKDQAPEEIVQSYFDWREWSNSTKQVVVLKEARMQTQEYKGQFVASPDWVTGVTYTKISDSVYGTVFLSIGLAAAVVFVFCGPLMMLFAAITVLMINLTVMGVLYLYNWKLGAVEAMSITSLVGLSVDFCIHMSEAFNHAQSTWTPDNAARHAFLSYFSSEPRGREKAKEALVLVAIPMMASAVSTVITTTPLFAAVTLILNRFASIIFVTMLVGLAYVFLFLTPMLAMFGPGFRRRKVISQDTPLHKVVTDLLLKSKGVRFIGVAFIAVLILVAIPETQQRLGSGDTLQELMVMLLAVAVVALCVFILNAFVKAAYHKKRHMENSQKHDQQQYAHYQQHMGRPSKGPVPTM